MENLSFTPTNIISILALFAAVVYAVQLFSFKEKKSPNSIFSIYLMGIAIIAGFFILLNIESTFWSYIALPFLLLSVLSLGPLLWIYVCLIVGQKSKKPIGHFYIPLTFFILVAIVLGLTQLNINKETIAVIIQILTVIVISGLTAVFLIQNIFYIYRIQKLYLNHLKNIVDSYSYTEKVNLKWFRLLIFGYIGFIFGLVITHFIDDTWSYLTFYIILLGYILFSGYNALKQQPVFKTDNKVIAKVSEATLLDLEQKLLRAMKEKELYLDSSLTIFKLAKELQTNSKYLSSIINNSFGKNFALFINEYRIKKAREILTKSENNQLTIEYVSELSGFKSKSAFNAAFKKITGITPSVYKVQSKSN